MTAPSTLPGRTGVPARLTTAGARRRAWWVAVVVTVCAAVASLLGLVLDDAYAGDRATAEMLRGYDAVTLLVVLPALALALRGARRGSVPAWLAVAVSLLYLAYTYAYYLFGTGFNDLLLLHAVVFSGSLAGLVLTLTSLDAPTVAAGFSERARVRPVAAVLGLLAVALGGMWTAACVAYILSGTIPAGSALVETDTVVHLGIALDLAVLVPLYGVAAVLLWRRQPWGYVLAALALGSGLLHQVSYLVALVFQEAAGVPRAVPFDPVEPVILLLYAGAAAGLLRGRRGAGTSSPRG